MSTLNVSINAGRRLAHRIHLRLGANGLAGVALALAAVVAFVYAQRAQDETVQIQAQTEQVRSRVVEDSAMHVDNVAPSERLTRFQNWFPTSDTSSADLRKIFKAAQISRLSLQRGEYNMTTIDGSGGLQKFDVIFPVKEHYGAVKSFVALVLNDLPHASLAELRVERPAAATDELDTRVHFTLYYRARAT